MHDYIKSLSHEIFLQSQCQKLQSYDMNNPLNQSQTKRHPKNQRIQTHTLHPKEKVNP